MMSVAQNMFVEAIGKRSRRLQAVLMDCNIKIKFHKDKEACGGYSGLCEITCPSPYHLQQVEAAMPMKEPLMHEREMLLSALMEISDVGNWMIGVKKGWKQENDGHLANKK